MPEIPVPGVVRLDVYNIGMSRIDPLPENMTQFEFQCHPGFYISSHMLGNGEVDCPDGRDERVAVEKMVCPGYYRCQVYGMCLHPDRVCDMVPDCPNKDDEIYCQFGDSLCPPTCTCEGYAMVCRAMFYPDIYPNTRYLDLSGVSGVSLGDFYFLEVLQFLNLSRCGLVNASLSLMPRLKILDLSHNQLASFSSSSLLLRDMVGLTYLDLSGNPVAPTLDSAFTRFVVLSGLEALETLKLRGTGLRSIREKPFRVLPALRTLDLRGNSLQDYDVGTLAGLGALEVLLTDEPQLCCPYFHPAQQQQQQRLAQCLSPTDELSSCSDLLRTDFFLVSLWLMAVLAVLGNAGVILFRLLARETEARVFRVLVVNLCAADLLLGVYMVVIGSAHLHFRRVYVSVEREWRTGLVCTMAGFLAFASSEMSTFVICLITLDRLLVICFPLKRRLHLTVRQSALACAALWVLAGTLAAVPLVTGMRFYEQNAVCLPLPITRREFAGQGYAFGVFIVFNFLLFLLIGAGQLLIYRAVRRAGSAAGSHRRAQDMSIARRLFLVVFSDFCCWFPIGALGLLASNGVPLSGEVNVWAAIFILPVNSALNPFLYTLNGALEQRRKRRLEERMKRMIGNLQTEIPKWKPDLVEETARICIKTKHVARAKVEQWMGLYGSEDTSLRGSSSSSEGAAGKRSAPAAGSNQV